MNADTCNSTPAKILVVDDHQTNRDIVRSFLQFEGYEVFEAHDGREALKKALEVTPDLVLLDILMPKLDGYGSQSPGGGSPGREPARSTS